MSLSFGPISFEPISGDAVQAITGVGGIQSAEAFGIPVVNLTAKPVGIGSVEAVGTPSLSLRVVPTGIQSAEAFGTPVVGVVQTVLPAGIPSAEALGAPTVRIFTPPLKAGGGRSNSIGKARVKKLRVTRKVQVITGAGGIGNTEYFGQVAVTAVPLPDFEMWTNEELRIEMIVDALNLNTAHREISFNQRLLGSMDTDAQSDMNVESGFLEDTGIIDEMVTARISEMVLSDERLDP